MSLPSEKVNFALVACFVLSISIFNDAEVKSRKIKCKSEKEDIKKKGFQLYFYRDLKTHNTNY